MTRKSSVSKAKPPIATIETSTTEDVLEVSLKNGLTFSFEYRNDGVLEILSLPSSEKEDDKNQQPEMHHVMRHQPYSSDQVDSRKSYSYFTNLDQTYIFIKIETEKDVFFRVPTLELTFSGEVAPDLYETEKWWFQLVSEIYPEGYDKEGRPADHKKNSQEYKYNFTLLDSYGSETDVDRDVFDTYFPECKEMVCYRNEQSQKIWGSYEVVRVLAWYLKGNEPSSEGFDSLGELILLSEEYKSPYLKHWCIKRILSTQWGRISLPSAAGLYEALSETHCEEMKQLKPLLFRLVQQKMMTMDKTRWKPNQMVVTGVPSVWTSPE
ncbi:hypothetical protein CJU90_1228 [Yarrowia sp. C11]|nr:hypothetical protein CKK34_2642 [Yarrowia sp. E02]KAG5373515.1 hypothetical protein CJU90_1228 [Yarrowia sp. C11]